jgi:hypothetical protein
MAEAVYLSCTLASLFCATLLVRNYLRTRLRLALIVCVGFLGLALNNVLLFVDVVVTSSTVDLSALRGGVALLAMLFLTLGLVLEET